MGATKAIRNGLGTAVRTVKKGVGKAVGAVKTLRDKAEARAHEATASMQPGPDAPEAEAQSASSGQSATSSNAPVESVAEHLDEVSEATVQRRNAVRFEGKPHHGDNFDDPRGRVNR
ncbi:MAG: hypothetical protein H0V89_13695 [Deltaproteobacteria bacterium]|nr:hypothetical protein [Deltaproteobacteria bacterium]